MKRYISPSGRYEAQMETSWPDGHCAGKARVRWAITDYRATKKAPLGRTVSEHRTRAEAERALAPQP